jgi:hypothetical protein
MDCSAFYQIIQQVRRYKRGTATSSKRPSMWCRYRNLFTLTYPGPGPGPGRCRTWSCTPCRRQ